MFVRYAKNRAACATNLKAMSACSYCGQKAFGRGCPHSPIRIHSHEAYVGHCIWCGSTAFGQGCPHSPDRRHVHAHGDGCIHCGSSARGQGCPYSPNRVHLH